MNMLTFMEWLKIREQENDDGISHSGQYKNVLNVGRGAMVGMSLQLNGPVGDKSYNMLPVTVKRFIPDDENPTSVELAIDSSDNPHLAQQVVWTGDEKDEKPLPAEADTGTITVSIEEFDKILGEPWGPTMKQMGGMGGMGI